MIIVLLNERATAIYSDVVSEKPNNNPIARARDEVRKNCPRAVRIETFPTSLIIFGLRLSPTIKSSNEIPRCENATNSPCYLIIENT